MINETQYRDLQGSDAVGSDGQKIGTVGDLFTDDETGRPTWATIKTGLFGRHQNFVPLEYADLREGRLVLPYDKDRIEDAPSIDVDEDHLTIDQETRLFHHYGLDRPSGDDDAMTRSEEQLVVGTERVPTGKARLHKYIVTEQQQVSVPLDKERVVVEHEPITDENRDEAMQGPDLVEDDYEMTTYEERPVVDKQTRPVEQVRLRTEKDTDTETVSENVRKERIEEDNPQFP